MINFATMKATGKIISLVVVFSILASLSLILHGRLFGHEITREQETASESITRSGGTTIVNTTNIEGLPSGYAGKVPVDIYITDGRIDSVRPLPNKESPGFFSRLSQEGLTTAWNGKTLHEASSLHPDAVSGATYSSRAYIANVEAAVNLALDNGVDVQQSTAGHWSVAGIFALAVILLAALIPLFIHNKTYRTIQQILNVGVLGFWAGTFLNYAVMTGFFANGLIFSAASLATLAMLIISFIYPLFGHKSHYCVWVCPLGSAQELAGLLNKRKLKISPKTVRILEILRRILWVVLLSLLWIGIGTEWIHYELFQIFAVKSAGWAMISAAVLIIILSVFIPRPYCRFICPTGTILRSAQDTDN